MWPLKLASACRRVPFLPYRLCSTPTLLERKLPCLSTPVWLHSFLPSWFLMSSHIFSLVVVVMSFPYTCPRREEWCLKPPRSPTLWWCHSASWVLRLAKVPRSPPVSLFLKAWYAALHLVRGCQLLFAGLDGHVPVILDHRRRAS